MANTEWITNRREEVSRILVDSLRELGKSSKPHNTLDNSSAILSKVYQVSSVKSVEVQTSTVLCLNPSQSQPAQSQPAQSQPAQPQLANSQPTQSQPAHSQTDNYQFQNFEEIVPKLNLSLLDSARKCPRKAAGQCRYICVECGQDKDHEDHVSEPESINVYSPTLAEQCTEAAKEYQLSDSDDKDHKCDISSSFILKQLNLEDCPSPKIEVQRRGCDTKVNVVSICCVDPEDFLKEIALESARVQEIKIESTLKLEKRKLENRKLENTKKVEEECLLPEALTKLSSSAEVHTQQSDGELTKKTSSWKILNVAVEEAPDEQHNDTPVSQLPGNKARVLPPDLDKERRQSGNKVRVLPPDLDKERRESFGFMIPTEPGMEQDWQRRTSQTGSISSSRKGGLKGLFGFAKRKRDEFCKGSPTDSKDRVTKTTR